MCRKFLFCTLVVFFALSASKVLCSNVTTAVSNKHISSKEAATIAKRITGYPKAEVVSIKQHQTDRNDFPFGSPKKRLAWVVILKGISLTNSWPATNESINGLKVLLDAESGSLIRIDSVPSVTGHLKYLSGRMPEKEIKGWHSIIGLSPPPKTTFAEALKTDYFPSVIPKARQVSAYLVVLGSPPHSGLPSRGSYWVIVAGGFHAHVFLYAPNKAATEVMYVVKDWNGLSHLTIFQPSPEDKVVY